MHRILTGTWEGSGTTTTYEKMVIVKTGDSYAGYTYDEGMGGYCKANFLGLFDPSSKKLKGKGMGFIEKAFTTARVRATLPIPQPVISIF